MKKFLKNSVRIVYFISALIIAVSITYGISMISDRSRGPLTMLSDKVIQLVYNLEHKIILDRREDQRIYKLNWFANYRNDKEKLIHPEFLLLGASDASHKNSYENIINLEDSLQTTFPLIHIYSAWGSKPEQQFPESAVKTIYDMGSIPVITWEPWVTDFDEKLLELPPLEKRNVKPMLSIANGMYDIYIKEWAIRAKKFGHPVYLRFAHEMNDPYRYPWGPKNDNQPDEYVKAWQHVHDIFTSMGADNVIWAWGPHLSYSLFDEYYPGDKYVDIISTGVLNYGTEASWSKWWSFDKLFGTYYNEIVRFKKPIMIAEFGSLKEGGNRAQWFSDALHRLPDKYPAISSVIFFHYAEDYTVVNRKVNWYFKDDSTIITTIRKELEPILKIKRSDKK